MSRLELLSILLILEPGLLLRGEPGAEVHWPSCVKDEGMDFIAAWKGRLDESGTEVFAV
jgi:hypothetical protein